MIFKCTHFISKLHIVFNVVNCVVSRSDYNHSKDTDIDTEMHMGK